MPKISHGTRKRGITPQGWWSSPIAGIVHYQSGYEWRFMEWLDNHNIQWKKCDEHFDYVSPLDNKKHRYTPDFVIEDDKGEEFYIEVKGALRGNDPAKFEAFPNDKNLVLLSYKELHDDLKIDVKDPTQNTVKDPTKWPYTILSKIPDWNTKGILTEELKEKVSPNKLYLSIKISV